MDKGTRDIRKLGTINIRNKCSGSGSVIILSPKDSDSHPKLLILDLDPAPDLDPPRPLFQSEHKMSFKNILSFQILHNHADDNT